MSKLRIFVYPTEIFEVHQLGPKSWRVGVRFSDGPKKGLSAYGKSGTDEGAYRNALLRLKLLDRFGSRYA